MLDEIDGLRGTLRALLDRNITFLDQDAIFPFESHTQAFNHITEARDLAFRNYQERDMTTHIATGIQGLTFTIGDDGVWLNASSNGKHTSINLANYAKEGGAVTNGLLEWCKEFAAREGKEPASA